MPQQGEGIDSDDESEAADSAPVSARSAISRESPPVRAAGVAHVGKPLLDGWQRVRGSAEEGGGLGVQEGRAIGCWVPILPCASPVCLPGQHLDPLPPPPPPQTKVPMRDDLKAGWLEKRSGDSSSLNALPVDSWKWQRRWFVLAMESGFLYYFRSPQEMTSTGVSPKVATIVPNPAHPPPRAARCTRHCAVRRVPLQRTERLMQPTCAVEAISGQPSARWMPSTLRLSFPPSLPCR